MLAKLAPVLAVSLLSCHGAMPARTATMAIVLGQAKIVAAGHMTYFIGGDSRGDSGGVLPWAFEQAKAAGARAFFFLGDMEWSQKCDPSFESKEVDHLGEVPLYPALGNHEIRWFGWLKYTRKQQVRIEQKFQDRFLTPKGISLPPVEGSPRAIFYAKDLETATDKEGLHFVALDNVSLGRFGRSQIDWLRSDLKNARGRGQLTIVGMHKPLAYNCTGNHSMAEDGDAAVSDSEEVLGILAGESDDERPVEAIFASHDHYFAQFAQRIGNKRIKTYVTGGLGAHLKACTCSDCEPFHHVLQLDVGDKSLDVSVIQWPHPSPRSFAGGGEDDEDENDSGQGTWDLRCR